jgi:hypothetical protein
MHSLLGFRFVQLTVETLGQFGKPFMRLSPQLGDLTVVRSDGLFTQVRFVSGVMRLECAGVNSKLVRSMLKRVSSIEAAAPPRYMDWTS